MFTLAYGGFDFSSPDGDISRTLGAYFRMLFPVLLCYGIGSVMVEKMKRCRVAGVLVAPVIWQLFVSGYGVKGEFGPAHLAMDAAVTGGRVFGGLLLGKFLLLTTLDFRGYLRGRHPDQAFLAQHSRSSD